jgi:tetratricopeptide (TPR) repeat protein
MASHISRANLKSFLSGSLSSTQVKPIIRHLLSGCEYCQSRLRTAASDTYSINGAALDAFVGHLLASESQTRREALLAPSLFTTLESVSRDQAIMMISNSERYRTMALFRETLKKARAYSIDRRLFEAQHLTHLALVMAESMHDYPETVINVCRAESYTVLGNIARLSLDFNRAAETLNRADELLFSGTGDIEAEAESLSIRASLLEDIGHFEDAIRVIRKLLRLYHELGDSVLEGKALVQLATVYYDMDRPAEGVKVSSRAMSMIPPDCFLYSCAVHIHIDCLNDTGESFAALSLYRSHDWSRITSPGHKISIEFLAAKLAHKLTITI